MVGIRRPKETRRAMQASLLELARLIDTAGGVVVGQTSQELKRIASATLIHQGKIQEIKTAMEALQCTTVAFDSELSSAQQRNLQEALGAKILDRTAVILDIFARRAHTAAGKLQVELAQLQYRLTQLAGRGMELMQQSGHIGNRGPGETKLEIDRRRIRERVTVLQGRLKDLRAHRGRHQQNRTARALPLVALIGYTNAGKSTLMNALTRAGVLVEDQLFATLDPTVRQLRLPSGRRILLSDTVGFIRRLPHELVEAFHATFEELQNATLLCHLIDATSEEIDVETEVVMQLLRDLQLHALPRLTVFSKHDLMDPFPAVDGGPSEHPPHPTLSPLGEGKRIAISARTGYGVDTLLARIECLLDTQLVAMQLALPHTHAQLLHTLYERGHVSCVVHGESAIHVDARVPRDLVAQCAEWITTVPM